MYWQMKLPVIDASDVKAICSSDVKNHHVSDRCYVTWSQDVLWLILFWFFMMVKN